MPQLSGTSSLPWTFAQCHGCSALKHSRCILMDPSCTYWYLIILYPNCIPLKKKNWTTALEALTLGSYKATDWPLNEYNIHLKKLVYCWQNEGNIFHIMTRTTEPKKMCLMAVRKQWFSNHLQPHKTIISLTLVPYLVSTASIANPGVSISSITVAPFWMLLVEGEEEGEQCSVADWGFPLRICVPRSLMESILFSSFSSLRVRKTYTEDTIQ